MFTDLYIGIKGICQQIDRHDTPVTVGLYWTNHNPAEITISIRHPFDPQPAVWCVSRNSLIVASTPFYAGAWCGGGSFSTCHQGDRFRFAFKPPWLDRAEWGFVHVPAQPVVDFITHSRRIIDAGPAEEAITLGLVDKALEKILG